MGLLDDLNLGGVLRGALGEVEAAALPAAINTVLAKTPYHDLNGLVAALQKGGLNAQVQSGSGRAPTFRSPKTSSRPFSATRKYRISRAISACRSTRHLSCWRNTSPTSSTKRARTARCNRGNRSNRLVRVGGRPSFIGATMETKMKSIALVFASFCFVTAAFAEDSCKVQATGKSLHGAALASFAKKCCKDQAAAQKLHGAAETSFTKKCVSDATAS